MPEEILFEIPEVRITTERLTFDNSTFEVNYVASTDVEERHNVWVSGVLVLIVAFLMSYFVAPLLGTEMALFLTMLSMSLLFYWLPREHVLTIRMKDKMFYEVITRTREESEIIQRYVDEAINTGRNHAVAIP